MIAKNDELWETVRWLVGNGDSWSIEKSGALASIFRVYIHQAYADRNSATYAPGRDRGYAFRKIPSFILEHVQDLPGKVVEGFKAGATGLPSVAAVLAQRAKGDPIGLMEETLRVRHEARHLRRHVDRVVTLTIAGDGKAHIRAVQEMEQLTADLRASLRTPSTFVLPKRSALDIFNRDGLLLTLLGWGSAPLRSLSRMADALTSLLQFKRIAVLTEMAAEITTVGIDPTALAALERGVGPGKRENRNNRL